ncbi:hypothetical protein ACQ5SO_16195 [Rhodovulum sp. DZ06]|uniref:hypothetical protein n=1 Tax=Rhodovulum sp. DZ06 TaxID=3425126 RepID=UPI003D34BBBC
MTTPRPKTRSRGGAIALAAMLAGACAPGADLVQNERKPIDKATGKVNSPHASPLHLEEFDQLISYGVALSETYVSAADQVATAQDAAAVGIIAAAATAVGGLAFGGPASVAGGAGLAGGVLAAGTEYMNGPAAINALLDASTQVGCVARAGQASLHLKGLYAEHPEFDHQRKSIVQGGYMKARVELRRGLIRQPPDYAASFTALKSASEAAKNSGAEAVAAVASAQAAETAAEVAEAGDKKAEAKADETRAKVKAQRAALKATNDTMLTATAECFLPAPIAEAAKE